jgi:hypothetical protein
VLTSDTSAEGLRNPRQTRVRRGLSPGTEAASRPGSWAPVAVLTSDRGAEAWAEPRDGGSVEARPVAVLASDTDAEGMGCAPGRRQRRGPAAAPRGGAHGRHER